MCVTLYTGDSERGRKRWTGGLYGTRAAIASSAGCGGVLERLTNACAARAWANV